MVINEEERAILLGALDLAAKHLGAQLSQAGLQAAGDASGRIASVNALAIKVQQSQVDDEVEEDQ